MLDTKLIYSDYTESEKYLTAVLSSAFCRDDSLKRYSVLQVFCGLNKPNFLLFSYNLILHFFSQGDYIKVTIS